VSGPDRTLDLVALPKAELHLHLEATMAADTAAELADRSGLPLPPGGPFADQGAFVSAYERARDLVGTVDDVRRLAAELARRQAADGVVWSEVHLVPSTYAGRLGPADGVVEAFLDGAGDGVGLVLGINRALGLAEAERALDLALRWHGRGVVALGFAGNEADHPPAPYAPVFARAAAAGLPQVPHCGEGAGTASVRATLDLAPDRVCHGVDAAADDALVTDLVAQDICLDMAPSSNVMLGIVPTLTDHPLPSLRRRGVPVTVSTDIPGFLGHGLSTELALCADAWSLDAGDVVGLAETSVRRSYAPAWIRDPALGALGDLLR
jgi:adenosine deaminase